MIEAIIIDDEEDGREALRIAIEKYCPGIQLKGVFENPEQGLEGIRSLKPQLVFLDVQMPGMSGFDLLQRASPILFDVIFVSAHDRYAIKAIKFSALDYLLKPIDVDDLIHAVARVNERLVSRNSNFPVQSVLHNLQFQSRKIDRIAIPTLEGIDFFDTRDIIYGKAEGSYTQLVMTSQSVVMVSRNLKDFEELLAESGFCRVHHSYLINLSHVNRYIKGDGGYVILSNNHHVDVSRRKKDEFLILLKRL